MPLPPTHNPKVEHFWNAASCFAASPKTPGSMAAARTILELQPRPEAADDDCTERKLVSHTARRIPD